MVPLLDAAQGNLDQARGNIEVWFEHEMDRVSGWYKRHTIRMLMVIGLCWAIIFNIDTLQILTILAHSAELRRSLANAADTIVRTNQFAGVQIDTSSSDAKLAQKDLAQFASGVAEFQKEGLPVGFECLSLGSPNDSFKVVRGRCWQNLAQRSVASWVLKVLGWIITGFAVSLGAPFWFELLNKLVNMRAAGQKPILASEAEPLPRK
jgi:hypothetical protein